LLSDAAASTQKKKKKKNSLFATNKKTGTYLMGATTATSKCLQRLSIQIAKQHKTTRSSHKRRAKNVSCGKKFWIKRKERTKIITNLPQNQKTCPNKLLQEREKSGDGVHNKRTFTLSLSLSLSLSLFGFSCLKLQTLLFYLLSFSHVFMGCVHKSQTLFFFVAFSLQALLYLHTYPLSTLKGHNLLNLFKSNFFQGHFKLFNNIFQHE
jgi:hypothetical protein